MSIQKTELTFTEHEEATDLLVVTTDLEDEDTDVIHRCETTDGHIRNTSKDGSDFAFLFRLN